MASNTNIQQNVTPSEPHLRDLLDLHKKEIFLEFNSHHIGTVQSFDATSQTASATVNYKKTFFEFDQTNNVYTPVLVDYPVISQCPVIFLGGGPVTLSFPVAAGDECLILFNDRDLDNWYTGNTGSPNATARLHSFSDAVILVGLRSTNTMIANFDSTRSLLQAGTSANSIVALGINPSNSKILITNTYPGNATTLNTLLQNLVTDVSNLIKAMTDNAAAFIAVTGGPGGPSPLSPAIVTALGSVSTSLTTLGMNLGGLLE